MQLPPIEVIAAWPQPNYVNPTDVRGPAILILTLIFVTILVILVALRIYTRLHLSKNFGADDVAIIAATFPTIGCAAVALVAVLNYGWSRHIWDVPPDQLVTGLKFIIAVDICFVTGASLTKVSMLLLINRVMVASSITLKRILKVLMFIVCVDCIIYFIVVINNCSPVSDYWTLSFTPQNCINERAHLLAGGIINTVTDFCVVLIPIPVVLKLRLPLRQRIACAMLFGAGFIVCIAAGVRMSYTWQLNTTYDKTWLAYPVWISGTIELYLGIIATSIPAIKPLVSRYFPKVLGNSQVKYGQPSLNSYVMANQPPVDVERNASPTLVVGPNDFDFDLTPQTKGIVSETITTISAGKSKTRHLSPPMTLFTSCNRTGKKADEGADLKKLPNPPEDVESSKTSLSSFRTGWQAAQENALDGSKQVQKVESTENLVGTGTRE